MYLDNSVLQLDNSIFALCGRFVASEIRILLSAGYHWFYWLVNGGVEHIALGLGHLKVLGLEFGNAFTLDMV